MAKMSRFMANLERSSGFRQHSFVFYNKIDHYEKN